MSRFRVETMPAGVPGPAGAGEIVHLVMDDPAGATNVLDAAALEDLDAALAGLESRPGLGGVVVRSAKRGSFVSGADVEAIGPAADRDAVRSAIGRAQQVLARLAALPCPTVAAIDGACLGGGLELALACASRVASDEPHTRLGLPEILLGGIPAFGGTVRLPRLVGTAAALDLVLGGRLLGAREAESVGLVARAVPAGCLVEHAHRRLAELTPGAPGAGGRDRWRPRGPLAWLADGTAAGRALAFARAGAQARVRTRGVYPAPVAALSVLRHGSSLPPAEAMRLEADWASDLAVGPVCRNLVRAARLVAPGVAAAGSVVERLHVVGAGATGAGLAELAGRHGIEVRLRDGDPAALARALRFVRARVAERAAAGRLAPHEAAALLARVRPAPEPTGLGRADLAFETVAEELDVKRRVLAELEVRMRPDAVLATGTALLGVDELAAGLGHPERFVGLHFLPPLERRPLVEVVRGTKTADGTLATALAFVRRLGRVPVVVRDSPGFAVDRVVMSGLREALHLLEEGYRVADVDAALRDFGMAQGPFETLDEMGIDAAARLAAALAGAFPERFAPTPQLEALAAAGRDAGGARPPGFYRRRGGRRVPDPRAERLAGAARRRPDHPGALADRVVLAMVNEAVFCLADGVVPDADAMDLVSLHGAGFPRFRGGWLRYADARGLAGVEARLGALRAEKGERFRPAPMLAQLAAAGGTFTGSPVA